MSTRTRPGTGAAARARQEAALREARRRRAVAWGGGVLIVALLAAIAAVLVSAAGGDDGDAPAAPSTAGVPANTTADGAVPVGRADAPVTVTVYFDYMCPFCGRFEAANSDELAQLVDEGRARVELRPLSFLDPQSDGTEYSTRAANALATVADGAPDRVLAFHRALFDQQPEEGTAGPDDARLTRTAQQAGVPSEVSDRFAERTYDGWVAQVTEKAFASGVQGTPTVLVDGEPFAGDLYAPGVLAEAVRTAADR